MSFKYQAPMGYKAKTLVISGQTYAVKNGVIDTQHDIYHLLAPLGFRRAVSSADVKKPVATIKS